MKYFGILLIFAAAMFRLVPHPVNFTPIAAIALAGGVYLDKRLAFVIPLLAMLLSDLIIGFHATMPFVYISFALISLMGIWLRSHVNIKNTVLTTLTGSILFFIITNFGVWVMGGYPQTYEGLVACYVAAIPFFRNTLLGDAICVSVLFSAFAFSNYYSLAIERK
jgi:hypothetical protein